MKPFILFIIIFFVVLGGIMMMADSIEQQCADRGGKTHWLYGLSNLCVDKDGRII